MNFKDFIKEPEQEFLFNVFDIDDHLDEYYSLKFPCARIACNQFFKEKNIIPLKQVVRSGEFERWYFTR